MGAIAGTRLRNSRHMSQRGQILSVPSWGRGWNAFEKHYTRFRAAAQPPRLSLLLLCDMTLFLSSCKPSIVPRILNET